MSDRDVQCAAGPDHADIMETIENAADDWQKQGYKTALAEVRDMANVGRALMEALPEGYSYNDCPSEIVADLMNERDEAVATAAVVDAGQIGSDHPLWNAAIDAHDATPHLSGCHGRVSNTVHGWQPCDCYRHIRAMIAFAATPTPPAGGK